MTAVPSQDMPFFGHLRELRTRLVRASLFLCLGMLIALPLAKPIYSLLSRPILPHLPEGSHFMTLGVMEAWGVYFQIALVAGIFLSAPCWLYHLWAFVAPGLIKRERRFVTTVSFFGGFCFLLGGLFCYFVMMPFGFGFLTSLTEGTGIAFMPQMNLYFSFVLKLLIAFGLVFELPLVIVFLVRWDIVSIKTFKRHRRHMIVVAFIVGAVLTPPDVFSQCLMAAPFILLFEVGLLVAHFSRPREIDPEKALKRL